MKKNRIIYALILILAYLFANLYKGKVPYIVFYVLLILPVMSFAYTLAAYISFRYTQDVDKKTAVKGEKVNFFFNIVNESIFLYPYVRTIFYGDDTIFSDQFASKAFSLSPYKNASFSTQLLCKYRGLYHIGVRSFEFEDLLGLFKMRYLINQDKQITVYPRIIQLDRFSLKSNYISDSHNLLNKGSEDNTTVSDFRKYGYGDAFKRIHWKLTAKMNELHVKNYNSTSETNATIFLDLKKLDMSNENRAILEDMLIESTVSIINFCLASWIPINFVYLKTELIRQNSYNTELINMSGVNPLDFENMYKVLSKITFTDNVDLKDVLDIYFVENYKKSNIVILTASLDYELFNQLHKLKFSGHELSLIYISPELLTHSDPDIENILSFLPEIGVRTYKIDIYDDIKVKLES